MSVDAYAGIVDRRDGRWRLAFGLGYRREVLTSANVISIKLPFFINAGLLGAKEDKGNKLPVHVQYDGLVRIMPSFQITEAPNQPTGWSFLINLELLGNRNLFTRADSLYK